MKFFKLVLISLLSVSFNNLSFAYSEPTEAEKEKIMGEATGAYIEGDHTKAVQIFSEGCEKEFELACFSLLSLYEEEIRQDRNKAIQFYGTACRGGYMEACVLLGAVYDVEEKKGQNYKRASELYERACIGRYNYNGHMGGVYYSNQNAKGCYNLGVLYENGRGVRQSFSTAKEYYGKACDLGFQNGCDKFKELNLKEH